jgi:ribosomal protein S18 acetylase RimI-like enzyme
LRTPGYHLALRPVEAGDQAFLFRLYASTRADELAPLGWDQTTTQAFLRTQFDLQDRAYHQAYPDGSFALVLIDGDPGGRLYVQRSRACIHVIDISLLPEYRGRGIGTALLRELLGEGRRSGTPVTIDALRTGRAVSLYQRLGFTITRADDVYAALRWRPPVRPRIDAGRVSGEGSRGAQDHHAGH